MKKDELVYQLEQKELQHSTLISTNSTIADQLKNLWEEIGWKNDMIRDLKYELAAVKLERDSYKTRWRRCITDKYEQKQKEDEKDKAIFEKILSDERTDN
jgi:hypothetical protein